MAEAIANVVRLVQCPNCGNLLPEISDYSAYQCGACGTALKADKENGGVDPSLNNSVEERLPRFPERLLQNSENLLVSGMSSNVPIPEDDTISNVSSSSYRTERRRFSRDTNEPHRAVFYDDDDVIANSHSRNQSFEEMKFRTRFVNDLQGSGKQWDRRFGRTNEMDGFSRPPRNDVVSTSYSTSKYSEEGMPLNTQLQGSYNGYREPLNKIDGLHGRDGIVGLPGEDRATILRKLEELKLQVLRSGDVVDRSKNKFPLERRNVSPDPYGYAEEFLTDGYSYMGRHPLPYVNQYIETTPLGNRHGFYPPLRLPGHVQEFGNVVPMDHYYSHRPNVSYHHPSCSCFHCYEQYQIQGRAQVRVPPNAYGARQVSNVAKDPAFYHHEYESTVGSRDHRETYHDGFTSFKSSNPPSHQRWPSDLKSEASSVFVHKQNRPARILVSSGSRKCHPVAGGAPFLACQSCHELLWLPKKVVLDVNPKKMRCGACSILIEVTVDSKNLNVVISSVVNRTNDVNLSSGEDLNQWSGNQNKAHEKFASDDFDNSDCNYESMDRELGSTPNGAGKSPHSTLSSSSDKELRLDDESLPDMGNKSNYNAPELLVKGIELPPPAGSSLQELFEYSNKYHRPKHHGNGNRSGLSERNKMTPPVKASFRQSTTNDGSATEIEISSNEYANTTGTSLDSGEARHEGKVQMKAHKTADSFFASMIKRSFRNSNKSMTDDSVQEEQANVTVNGNLIPDRLIKKASILAGPIHPGHYWYDFRAGFWGVMGGPCLGIIPPFIEEFNYPMPENCAGGTTGVVVNGRELHPKDLKLLASRGLPTDGKRSFILEISGRVLDADTGEELESLGKLAPT
ncbi:OLC1v1038416C2 [Oldenlandia corymbosa var. corymbosa]|nr:OLC1v1038416C2 [Oldenlandia corymbosa var. corymbosa]